MVHCEFNEISMSINNSEIQKLFNENHGKITKKVKQYFRKQAETLFHEVIADENKIKEAVISRQCIYLNQVIIEEKDLADISLSDFLNKDGIEIDGRVQQNCIPDNLDSVICAGATWQAINECGLSQYFQLMNKNSEGSPEELFFHYKEFDGELRNHLTEQYKNTKHIGTFQPTSHPYELYQYLNYTLMFMETLAMCYGVFAALPCLIVGILLLATSIYINHALTQEIEKHKSFII